MSDFSCGTNNVRARPSSSSGRADGVGLADLSVTAARALLVLPGGIYVNFSGHDVRHADGRQLQRVGIQPQIKVEPTPRGIREGRDEVLEAAIKYLNAALKK